MLLAVSGMVGTGKTTLSRALALRFGLQLALESVDADNPWLARFYEDEEGARRWGLHLQLHFLATRFAALRRMRARGGGWVLDRTWYEDAEIFARGLFESGSIAPVEFELYEQLYTELLHSPAARPPRLLVYLRAPLEVVLSRIATRGRPTERDVAREYWESLHARYERWITAFRRCPVLVVDVRDYDLVTDPAAVEHVAGRVRRSLDGEVPQQDLWAIEMS